MYRSVRCIKLRYAPDIRGLGVLLDAMETGGDSEAESLCSPPCRTPHHAALPVMR